MKNLQIITADYLLSLDQPLQKQAGIAYTGGEIIDSGLRDDLVKKYPEASVEHAEGCVLMPGLINAHVHLELSGHVHSDKDPVRKNLSDVSFADWIISNCEYQKKTPLTNQREGFKEGLVNAIAQGTTTLGNMGCYDESALLLKEQKIRAVHYHQIYHDGSQKTQERYEQALAFTDTNKQEINSDVLLVHGLAPHAPFMVSRQILKMTGLYANADHIPLAIHVAESFSEMELFYNSTGAFAGVLFPYLGWGDDLPPAFLKTPIAYLDDIGFLNAAPLLIGCVQVTPEDCRRIANKKARVVFSPRSNHYLKLGFPAVRDMLKLNIPVGLGTEGLSSNASLSLWDEMRFLTHLVQTGAMSPLTSTEILSLATTGGAAALGLEKQVGSLTAGKKADFLLVKNGHSDFETEEACIAHLINTTKSTHITRVVVNGVELK